jgi:hypothetical protein
MLDTAQRQSLATPHTSDSECHQDTMVAMTVNDDTALDTLRASSHNDGVAVRRHLTSCLSQFMTEVVDTIRLFVV